MALNRNLTKDETRRQKAMKVLNVMLSEDAQNRIVYDGQDILSYSQDVDTHLTEYLKDVRPVIEENHMYIRIASNDFFNVSLRSEKAMELIKGLCLAESISLESSGPLSTIELFLILSSLGLL